LFDRARAADLAGIDRLAGLLGRALTGEPVQGAPRSVRSMARRHRSRAWPMDGLARLHREARRRAGRSGRESAETREAAARELGGAVTELLLGAPAPVSVDLCAGALLRLAGLLGPTADRDATRSIGEECARLRPDLLGVARDLVRLPDAWQRPVTYLLLASLHLLTELEDRGADSLGKPLRIAWSRRVALYAKARWRGLDSFGD
jgi:hypothetical protein